MTTQELQQAFSNKFMEKRLGFREFEQDTEDWTNTMEVRTESDKFWAKFVTYEKDWMELLTAEQLVDRINNEGWELQDLNNDQKHDLELQAMPEVDPISEATYTTKSGYTMHMFLVSADVCWSRQAFDWVEEKVKSMRGWYNKKDHGFMMRSKSDAERVLQLAERANSYDMKSAIEKKMTGYRPF